MDISRAEQRILHLLAQGGRIEPVRDGRRKITELKLITREGWLFADLDLETFRKRRPDDFAAQSAALDTGLGQS